MRWVHRVWDRLTELDGRAPMYLDRENIAGLCPVCREGTIRVHFIEHPEPAIRVTSAEWANHCSLGCSAATIGRVMFG